MTELERFEPLPLRGALLCGDLGDERTSVAVPIYFKRAPWAVVPFVDYEGNTDEIGCQVMHEQLGEPLLKTPVSSDAAILFVLKCAGVDIFGAEHVSPACQRVRAALHEITSRRWRCDLCPTEPA